MRRKRFVFAGAVIGLGLLAVPVGANVVGPCDGSVTIAGVSYGPENDTVDDPILVPADKSGVVAAWEGTTGSPITEHSGAVGIVIGPTTVEIADWTGENADLETSAAGTYALDSLPSFIQDMTGIYEVTATHTGTGGSCEGMVIVKLEGNAATTPVGAVSIGGTLLAAAGLAMAGRGKAL